MEFMTIGKIVKPQGVKGEVKILLYTNDSSALKNATDYYLVKQSENKLTKAKTVSIRFGFAYILFEGCSSREDAEKLRNVEVSINRDDFTLKDEDSFLVEDILGFEIFDQKGNKIGILTDVDQYGAADVWTLAEANGRRFSFPYISKIVKNVDVKTKTITISKPDYEEVKV